MLIVLSPKYVVPDEQVLETLRRGIEHRVQVLMPIDCSAVVEVTYSQRELDRLRDRLVAGHRAPPPRPDLAATPTEAADIPPLGNTEAAWVRFQEDDTRCRTLVEIQALTNNGHPTVPTTFDAAIQASRGMPAAMLYWVLSCDGLTVRTYDRGSGTGREVPYESPADVTAPHYLQLCADVLVGMAPEDLAQWTEGRSTSRYVGERDIAPWGPCHEVLLVTDYGRIVGIQRLLISPRLGFAVVERTKANVDVGANETEGGPKLLRIYWMRATDHQEEATDVWCPHRVERVVYDYRLGEESDAWRDTRIYRVLELEAGMEAPDFSVCPFFPLGTSVRGPRESPMMVTAGPELEGPVASAPAAPLDLGEAMTIVRSVLGRDAGQ